MSVRLLHQTPQCVQIGTKSRYQQLVLKEFPLGEKVEQNGRWTFLRTAFSELLCPEAANDILYTSSGSSLFV